MNYDPTRHHRRSIRLKGYDYSGCGIYFVTLRAYKGKQIFGNLINGKIYLNEMGIIVQREWLRTSNLRKNIEIDEFIIMPDHLHGIIVINQWYNKNVCDNVVGAHCNVPLQPSNISQYQNTMGKQIEQFGKSTKNSLPTIIKLFKSSTTKKINNLRNTLGAHVWQRNYYEHIIRNEKALNRIRAYIKNNPLK